MELPPNVIEADTKYNWQPKAKKADKPLGYEELNKLGLNFQSGWPGHLCFYKVPRFGWVIATLEIRKRGRRHSAQSTDRTYGIVVDTKALCCVGMGPHVTATVTVHLTQGNLKRMTPYIELWKKGMADANVSRDRISSRRAQTSLRRGGRGDIGPYRSPWDMF